MSSRSQRPRSERTVPGSNSQIADLRVMKVPGRIQLNCGKTPFRCLGNSE
jgi:hypothetical protein